ncbi:hypothetical protein N0V88_006799 [Collariella sp. IMI 366227]|nr:hypothetical protein N0V88_006799 [Collariella sp. IMI 366227]
MSKAPAYTEDTKLGADLPRDAPTGQVYDDSYRTHGMNQPNPVVSDDAPVEDPMAKENPDSEAMLEKDEREAMDKSNILKGSRTRHAKPMGSYQEGEDE